MHGEAAHCANGWTTRGGANALLSGACDCVWVYAIFFSPERAHKKAGMKNGDDPSAVGRFRNITRTANTQFPRVRSQKARLQRTRYGRHLIPIRVHARAPALPDNTKTTTKLFPI